MKPSVQIPFQNDLSLTDHAFLTELRRASPDQRKVKLNTFIRELFVEFLALDSLDDISEDQDFVELGSDSMQAVDFKAKLEKSLDCSLRSTLLFDHPRLDLLTDYLINEVLDLPPDSVSPTQKPPQPTATAANLPQTGNQEIAIVAMAGIFPEAENAEALWVKVMSGEPLHLPAPTDAAKFAFARITTPPDTAALHELGITDAAYWAMDRQQQLLYRAIADALAAYGLGKQDLLKPTTGVFIAGQQTGYDDHSPYQIPIANKVSFQLNLKGPSETVNTFCTSAYVALHRAVQSLRSGECQQAIVGGVNIIDPQAFALAVTQGVYDPILSPSNQTHSFCADAAGYVRSEGVGAILLKPLDKAEQDGNPILAVVKGSAVHHGGRGYSYEAPNPQGLKETIRLGLERANVTADSIDYIEAHGIGNVMADALELGALNQVYRNFSQQPGKNWHISCIKPSIGHPELASGIACIIKAIKAFEHQTLPGIANLGDLNHELPDHLALGLQAANQIWPDTAAPKRIALNSYAIGGMNAHVILEKPSSPACQKTAGPQAQRVSMPPNNPISETPTPENDSVLAKLLQDVLGLDLQTLDKSLSMIDFGFDSIQVMQFVAEVNEALGLDIKFSQVLGIDDFDGFFQLIGSERANAPQSLPVRQEPVSLASGQTSAPLSEVQKGLWYINETSQDPIGFNTPITFKLAQKPDQELMRQALAQTLEEHPILRASFVQDENTEDLRQIIRPTAERTFCQTIIMEAGQTLPQALTKLMRIPFNLKDDPLVKLYLLSDSSNSQHYAFFVIHHIVFDGTSGGLFIKSFWDKYHAHCAGKPLPTKAPELAFFDFAQWEQAYLNSPKAQADKAWWQEQLGGQSPTINLPYDHLPQSGQAALDIGSQHLKLAKTTYAAIKQLATTEKITLSVWFLAAFQIFLSKLTQEKNIAVTTPTRGRPKLAHENSMGCYINLMVTRCELSAEQTFVELAQNTRQQFAKNLDHAFYPFPKILADLGLTLTNPKEVPFPVAYAYQNFFDDILYSDNAAYGVETLLNEIHQQTEDNFTLEIYDFSDDLQINFNYKRNLFDDSTISRLLRYFEHLLAEIVANPKQPVKHYNLLPEDERRHILLDFNQSAAEFPRGYCIHELFVQQARQTPNHTALVFQGATMSYAELANRSHALALYLQSVGTAPDGLIAVCMERSFDMIVAVMAILQAGAAYLPISPTNAPERIAYMLQNGAVKLLLTQSHLQDKLTGLETATPYQTLAIDSPATLSGIARQNGALQALATPENLAYVIYTSGTTGTPKGVMIRHESLVNMSDALIKSYGITPEDRILQFASLSFDMAVEEIFPYLMVGAGIVIREEDDMEAERFYRLVTGQKVTILNLVPMYYNVIDELDAGQKHQLFSQVRHITFGGDALPDAVLNALRKYPVRIFNVYGPSEYTVNTSIADVTDSAVNHIGKPIGNTQVYVLGDGLSVMPIGVAGELHIAGVGIAKGYLNQPELTAEKFLPNPFGPGMLYKSGDMMRWLPDGTLQPLGRTDDQVKIRGFRVELGEIERVLLTYPAIDSAAVVTQPQGQGKQLVAFYVSAADIDEQALKNHLRQRLPDYMIPAGWVKLDAIPVTTNGKLDRKKLEARTVSVVSDTPYTAPTNAIETALVEIWQAVLNVPQIGIHDNFFALGGHSLLAIQIVLRTNKKLAVNLSVSAFFDAGDIQHLAQVIAQAETATEDHNVGHFIGQSEAVIF